MLPNMRTEKEKSSKEFLEKSQKLNIKLLNIKKNIFLELYMIPFKNKFPQKKLNMFQYKKLNTQHKKKLNISLNQDKYKELNTTKQNTKFKNPNKLSNNNNQSNMSTNNLNKSFNNKYKNPFYNNPYPLSNNPYPLSNNLFNPPSLFNNNNPPYNMFNNPNNPLCINLIFLNNQSNISKTPFNLKFYLNNPWYNQLSLNLYNKHPSSKFNKPLNKTNPLP